MQESQWRLFEHRTNKSNKMRGTVLTVPVCEKQGGMCSRGEALPSKRHAVPHLLPVPKSQHTSVHAASTPPPLIHTAYYGLHPHQSCPPRSCTHTHTRTHTAVCKDLRYTDNTASLSSQHSMSAPPIVPLHCPPLISTHTSRRS